MKQFFIDVGLFLWLLFCIWIAVSWANVLINADPFTGNGNLMPGNAFVLLVNTTP